MLRFYTIVVFPLIIHQFVIGVESTFEENKVYYKATGAVKNQTDLKNVIPIVIEGQPPLSELAVTNTSKVIKTTKIMDNISKTVPQKGTSIKSNENLYSSTQSLSNYTKNLNRSRVVPITEIAGIEEVNSSSLETTKRTKPKPIVTIGEKEVDKPIPASPTNQSPFGIPRKIDYIVPGVITVTALPLLAIVFYVLYKRGRDYWDKRHYRRMDFLIDGMYNE